MRSCELGSAALKFKRHSADLPYRLERGDAKMRKFRTDAIVALRRAFLVSGIALLLGSAPAALAQGKPGYGSVPREPGGGSDCPQIPGYSRPKPNQPCSCGKAGAPVVSPTGRIVCSNTTSVPNYGYGNPFTKQCPFGGSALTIQSCEDYCQNCLQASYQADAWAMFWTIFDDLFFGRLANTSLDNLLKDLGVSNNKGMSCVAAFANQMISIVPAYRSGDPVSLANLWGDFNRVLLAVGTLCNTASCMQEFKKLGGPVGAKLSALFDFTCSVGVAGGHFAKCQASKWDCEATLYGNQAIPNCKGIIDNPIWRGRPIQEPQNACINCCMAQIGHVYGFCVEKPQSEFCQTRIRHCLKSCKRDDPPAQAPPPSACPVRRREEFCRTCPSGRCNQMMQSPYCYVDAPLVDDQDDCISYFSSQVPPIPACNAWMFCEPLNQ